jgi:transglutaminase-like putative cysteine protease
VRIRISHETAYRYETPVRSIMQALRVMPRDHEGQVVVSWRIEPSIDGRLRSDEDAFGNLVHQFQADGPFDHLAIRIDGIIETTDTTGFVRGVADVVPSGVFLRHTQATQPAEALIIFARKLARPEQTPLETLHALMSSLHGEMTLADDQDARPTTASEAFARRSGSAADMVHVFCVCARELGIPTRFVMGYLAPQREPVDPSVPRLAERHAWAESDVPGFGWIGFDPCLDLCPTDRHVRVAVGLDHADVAPVRMTRVGGGGETAHVALSVIRIDQ